MGAKKASERTGVHQEHLKAASDLMQLLYQHSKLGGDNLRILFPVSSSNCNIQALTLRRWALLWCSPDYIAQTTASFRALL